MKQSRSGFTLIELLVTLAIFIILGGVVLVNFAGRRTDTDLVDTTEQIGATLREAQSDAMAQKNGVAWGVHFSNSTATAPFYVLFSTSYSSATTAGYYPLPTSVAYNTSTLASGATLDVIFSEVTGGASVSTSIGLYMPKENVAYSSTISVASSGAVSY